MTDERMPPQEAHVEAFLQSLTDVAVPGDLPGAVSTSVREHPSRRPSLRLPLLAAAAGLLLTVSVAMAAGWQVPFDVLPGPQPTSPAPSASPDVAQPPEAWEFATIVQDGVELRSGPGTGTILGVTERGTIGIVLVRERRVVDGRTWVRIEQGYGDAGSFAWLPETVPSVAPAGYDVAVLERTTWLPCATGEMPPPLTTLSIATAPQRLACYGAASFTIGPVQAVPIFDDTADTGTPDWLAGPATMMLQAAADADNQVATVPVRINPVLGIQLPLDRWLTVTVHLDDPASASCVREPRFLDRPVGEPSDQVLWCRQQLVVTGYDEVPAPTLPAPTLPAQTPMPTLDGVKGFLPAAPIAGRSEESAAWTGSEFVVWGGVIRSDAYVPDDSPSDGAALDVGSGSWRVLATSPLEGRRGALAAWTGSEVLVWGGVSTRDDRWLIDGAAWDPATNAWRMLPAGPLVAGFPQAAAWAGDRWFVTSGGRLATYDAATATWSAGPDLPIGADETVSLAWSGDRLALLVQGPSRGSLWTMRPGEVWVSRAAPPLKQVKTEGMVFGGGRLWITGVGVRDGQAFEAIAGWDPRAGAWIDVLDVPAGTHGTAAVWSGSELVVVGRRSAAFDPAANTWALLPGVGDDRFREDPSVVWAGDRVIVWGGGMGENPLAPPDGWQVVWGGS